MYNEYNNNSRTNGRSNELEQHYDEHAENDIDDNDNNDDDNYAKTNKRFQRNTEQQHIVLLRSRQEFEEIVEKDQVNLCCVIVTSTLCKYCGVNKLKYPKYTPYNATNDRNNHENNLVNIDNSKNHNDYINGNDDHGEEDEQQDDNGENEDSEDEDKENNNINDESGVVIEEDEERNVLSHNHFFSEIKSRLVVSPHGLPQRKHVRFFHICLCAEDETDIQPLLACDITHTLSGEPPSAELEEQLHKKAYAQLIELLTSLEVCSTPCMLFFVRGQRIRYTHAPLSLKQMHDSNNNNSNHAVHHNTAGENAQHDTLIVSGCNYVKWKKTLHNAIVIRNEMLKAHDDAERDAARQARREAAAERKRLLKEARRAERRRRRQEEKELEEEEHDEGEGDDNDDASENDDEERAINTSEKKIIENLLRYKKIIE